jgi:hypothetical protein
MARFIVDDVGVCADGCQIFNGDESFHSVKAYLIIRSANGDDGDDDWTSYDAS